MTANRDLRAMQDNILAGRQEMQAGEYKAAISAFRKVCFACPCGFLTAVRRSWNPQSQPQPHDFLADCLWSEIAKAAPKGTIYEVVRTRCPCGHTKKRCRDELHLEALDKAAACYSALGSSDHAARMAAVIVHLAPELPMGYCRLSKVIRAAKAKKMDKNESQNLLNCPDLSSIAAAIVKQGLENVRLYGDMEDPLYKVLQVIHFTMSRSDPLTRFSNELKVMIFSHLTTSDICTCMRVSKGWNNAIEHDGKLWTNLELGNVKVPPSPRAFRLLLKRAQHATSLVVHDSKKLGLKHSRFVLIFSYLRKLQHLHLSGPTLRCHFDPGYDGAYPKGLKSLTLSGIMTSNEPTLASFLLDNSCDTLETLTLVRTIQEVHYELPQLFPNLKVLRLERSTDQSTGLTINDMDALIQSTPNLEQLYLDCFELGFRSRPSSIPIQLDEWNKLRVFVLGAHVTFKESPPYGRRRWPRISNEIHSIEILTESPEVAREILWGKRSTHTDVGCWDKLEIFRCRSPLPYARLEEVVTPSLQKGNLRVLDIPVTTECQNEDAALDILFPAGISPQQFALESDKLHTLGLSKFIFEDTLNYTTLFTTKPLLDMVAKFPNVHTVAAYPGAYARCGDVIRALLFHKGIRKIYQDCLAGVERDEIMKIAHKKGIEIVHCRKFVPSTFPKDLTRDN